MVVVVSVSLIVFAGAINAQYSGAVQSDAWSYSDTQKSESNGFYPRLSFTIQTDIAVDDPSESPVFMGGRIDTRIAYFGLTIGGNKGDKDVLIRVEYGANIFHFREEPESIICAVIGPIGLHAQDSMTSPYEWFFQVPFSLHDSSASSTGSHSPLAGSMATRCKAG